MNIWVDANGWPIPPTVLLLSIIADILYFRGWHILMKEEQNEHRKTARISSLAPSSIAVPAKEQQGAWFWRGIFFLGAIVALILASCAPIDILSSRLFWVHMVQHLLILSVMAPLLVAAAPLLPIWLGLPVWAQKLLLKLATPPVRQVFYKVGHWLRQPAISCAILVVGTWVWHWPPLYDFALTNDLIHDWGEHLTFLAVSVLFWTQIIPSPPLPFRTGYMGRMICIGIAIAQNVVLAVLIGFASAPLYAPYAHPLSALGGLSAIQDQQFGAGIMWTFGDVPFGIAISVLVQRWLAVQDRKTAHELQ
jgi:putative membrane protein